MTQLVPALAPRASVGPAVAAVVSISLAITWILLPIPMLPLFFGLVGLALLIAALRPLVVCFAFICVSLLRLPEAFPVLLPLHLPTILAFGTFAILFSSIVRSKLRPTWPTPLAALGVLFALVTLGIPIGFNPSAGAEVWTSVYWKVALTTLAIAWLPKRWEDLKLGTWMILGSGVAVASVAIYNKIYSIGLVEGSRVTIGRDIGSPLGDPNDLALFLLTPLSFGAAYLVASGGETSRTARALAGLATATLAAAIFFTQSRGAIFGLAAVFFTVGRHVFKSRLLLAILVPLAMVGFFFAMHIEDRSSGGFRGSGLDPSASARLGLWELALRTFLFHPIFGIGMGSFVSLPGNELGQVPHNTWLALLVESGLPGFIAFAVMIFSALSICLRQASLRQGNARAISVGCAASLLGTMIAGSFVTHAFDFSFYTAVGLAVALERIAQTSSSPSSSSPERALGADPAGS